MTLPAVQSSPPNLPKNIPLSTIIELKDRGLNHTEISKIVGCHVSNVTKRLNKVGYNQSYMNDYTKNKAKTLEFLQSQLVESVTPDKVKEAKLRDTIVSIGILNDKIRQEREQVTEVIAYADVMALKQQFEAKTIDKLQRLEELEAKGSKG